MRKKLLMPLVRILIFGLFFQQFAFADNKPNAPDARVAEFYSWFMKNDSDQTYPLNEKRIYSYVSKATVDRLKEDYKRSGPPGDVDYFLKVQDYDGRDWLAHVATRPAIMLGNVAVVPVTFGSKEKADVLVFMEKLDGVWKITKVEDTRPYR